MDTRLLKILEEETAKEKSKKKKKPIFKLKKEKSIMYYSGWHKDAKQNLGLEDYQVRKFGAIQKVVCAVLVAYTQIFLSKKPAILSPFKRTLNTIGEGCRFLRLIALKGWKWVKKKSKDIVEFSEILNSYVFVKNAKV